MVGVELQPPEVSRELSQSGAQGILCVPPAAPSTNPLAQPCRCTLLMYLPVGFDSWSADYSWDVQRV